MPISPNSSATPTSGIDKLKEVQAELDKHPDMPAALREAVLQRARELTGTIATVPQPAASTRESLRTFDSSQLQDGIYRFKVIASDRPSNALGFLTDESVSSPITICNAKPFVVLGKEGITTNPDGTVLVSGFAFQTMVTISSVQVRVDGGDWLSAAPSGEAFDKSLVGFQFTTAKLLPGEHKIEIKVFNSAGNSEIETTKVVSTGK